MGYSRYKAIEMNSGKIVFGQSIILLKKCWLLSEDFKVINECFEENNPLRYCYSVDHTTVMQSKCITDRNGIESFEKYIINHPQA